MMRRLCLFCLYEFEWPEGVGVEGCSQQNDFLFQEPWEQVGVSGVSGWVGVQQPFELLHSSVTSKGPRVSCVSRQKGGRQKRSKMHAREGGHDLLVGGLGGLCEPPLGRQQFLPDQKNSPLLQVEAGEGGVGVTERTQHLFEEDHLEPEPQLGLDEMC